MRPLWTITADWIDDDHEAEGTSSATIVDLDDRYRRTFYLRDDDGITYYKGEGYGDEFWHEAWAWGAAYAGTTTILDWTHTPII